MFEYLIKFIGLSPIVYYADPFAYLDTFIVLLAVSEYALPTDVQGSGDAEATFIITNLDFLKYFRIFRILRVTKVLKRIKSMRTIVVSMKKAIANVLYIVIILVMFILIFELLGTAMLNQSSHYKYFFLILNQFIYIFYLR